MPTNTLFKKSLFNSFRSKTLTKSHGEYSCEHLSEKPTNISAINILITNKPYINKSSADCLVITKALESPIINDLLISAIYV